MAKHRGVNIGNVASSLDGADIAELNKIRPGMGSRVQAALSSLANAHQALSGTKGPVELSKQQGKSVKGVRDPALILNSDRITGVADPINPDDAVNKRYADRQHACENLLKALTPCWPGPMQMMKKSSATSGGGCAPATLNPVATTDTGIGAINQINQVVARGDFLYLQAPGVFKIYYIGNPPGGVPQVGSVPVLGSTGYLVVQDSYAYLANINGGLQIVAIDRFDSPQVKSTTSIGDSIVGIDVAGKYAFITGSSGGNLKLFIVDISDPNAPFVFPPTTIGPAVGGVGLAGVQTLVRLIFFCEHHHGGSGVLHIYDFTDPSAPAPLSATTLPQNECFWVAFDGRYAYVAGDSSSDVAGQNQLTILDCINPNVPQIKSNIQFPSLACGTGVAVEGNHVYVTGSGIVQLVQFDVTDRTNPQLVGTGAAGSEITAEGAVPSVQGRYVYTARPLSGASNFRVEAYAIGGFFCEAIETNSLEVQGGRIWSDRISAKVGDFQVLSATVLDADLGFNIINEPFDPTTSDIPQGEYRVWKNTVTGLTKIWINDAGAMKALGPFV